MKKTIKIFAQHLYAANSQMTKSKNVIVTCHDPETLEVVATESVIIDEFGVTALECPEGLHFVSVKGEKMLETWSAEPVADYWDFTVAAEKAYGANQVEVETGIFAAFTGDVNSDGVIDQTDRDLIEGDFVGFENGEDLITDLNDDGIVDPTDIGMMMDSVGITVKKPMPLI